MALTTEFSKDKIQMIENCFFIFLMFNIFSTQVNINYTYFEVSSYSGRKIKNKETKNNRSWHRCSERGNLFTADMNANS